MAIRLKGRQGRVPESPMEAMSDSLQSIAQRNIRTSAIICGMPLLLCRPLGRGHRSPDAQHVHGQNSSTPAREVMLQTGNLVAAGA